MLKKQGTESKWIVKGAIMLLVAVFAMSPASSAEPVFESAEEVKEAYVHASHIIHLKARHGSSDWDEEDEVSRPSEDYLLTERDQQPSSTKIYLLHQCLKLFD